MLAMTLQNEKPELEVRKTELLKQEEDLKIQLAKLEESLLEVCMYILLSDNFAAAVLALMFFSVINTIIIFSSNFTFFVCALLWCVEILWWCSRCDCSVMQVHRGEWLDGSNSCLLLGLVSAEAVKYLLHRLGSRQDGEQQTERLMSAINPLESRGNYFVTSNNMKLPGGVGTCPVPSPLYQM